jgi:hypothetical protein
MLPSLSPSKESPQRLYTGGTSGLADPEVTTTMGASAVNPNEAKYNASLALDHMSIASFNPPNNARNNKTDRGKFILKIY